MSRKIKTGAQIVTEGRLRLSRAPTADLGAAALLAQKAAGLDTADIIIIAVEPGTASDQLGKDLAKFVATSLSSGKTTTNGGAA